MNQYTLTPITPATLKSLEIARKNEEAARKRMQERLLMDSQIGMFALTGSDRPADAPNQPHLF